MLTKNILFKDNTVNIEQFSKFTMKFKPKKKFLTENSNKFFWVGPFFEGRSGKGKQINFNLGLTRPDINQDVQPQKMARDLKLLIQEVEQLY